MGKIFCVMGKSASGKDTIYKRLLQERSLSLRRIVPGTTRPIRQGETPGVEYHFYTEEELTRLEKEGHILELRAYHTVHGVWKYFTTDQQIQLSSHDYLMIGTLESYLRMRDCLGADAMVPLYIEVEDGLRLSRALERERAQSEPKYAELCRRFLADEADFSSENLAAAGISVIFANTDLEDTIEQITQYIKTQLSGTIEV